MGIHWAYLVSSGCIQSIFFKKLKILRWAFLSVAFENWLESSGTGEVSWFMLSCWFYFLRYLILAVILSASVFSHPKFFISSSNCIMKLVIFPYQYITRLVQCGPEKVTTYSSGIYLTFTWNIVIDHYGEEIPFLKPLYQTCEVI